MIKSMTGFGRVFLQKEYGSIKVEIKSLNSKFLDLKVKLPKYFTYLEVIIFSKFKEIFERGKVEVYVDLQLNKSVRTPILNKTALKGYMNIIKDIQVNAGIIDDVKIDHLIHFDDVIAYTEDVNFEKTLESSIVDTIVKCGQELDKMRTEEGKFLKNHIMTQIDVIKNVNDFVKSEKDGVHQYWVEKFTNRLNEMLSKDTGIYDRIAQEAAIYAEKADISEEVIRIDSHLKQFINTSENEYPCGRKLDFICQELYREFNTIGSKSSNSQIIDGVIKAKSAIDKLREQVQNVV